MENKQYVIAQEEHDYNKKYEEGTIVKHTIDDVTTAYTAKKNVPQFISILNENYWKKIASTEEGGTVNYNNLKNKPTINGVELEGNIDSKDLGIDIKFKGWHSTLEQLQSECPSPTKGDYAYIKGETSSDLAIIYECNTNGIWSNSERTVDVSTQQTFASGEEVNEVHIINDDFDFLYSGEDIIGSELGKKITNNVNKANYLSKEQGDSLDMVSVLKKKDVTPTTYTHFEYKNSLTNKETDNLYNCALIPVSGISCLFVIGKQGQTNYRIFDSNGDEIKDGTYAYFRNQQNGSYNLPDDTCWFQFIYSISDQLDPSTINITALYYGEDSKVLIEQKEKDTGINVVNQIEFSELEHFKDGYQLMANPSSIGLNLNNVVTSSSASVRNVRIPISGKGYYKAVFYCYNSTSGYGSLVVDSNNIVIKAITKTSSQSNPSTLYLQDDAAEFIFSYYITSVDQPFNIQFFKKNGETFNEEISTETIGFDKEFKFDDLCSRYGIFKGGAFKPANGVHLDNIDFSTEPNIKYNVLIPLDNIDSIDAWMGLSNSGYGSAILDSNGYIVRSLVYTTSDYRTLIPQEGEAYFLYSYYFHSDNRRILTIHSGGELNKRVIQLESKIDEVGGGDNSVVTGLCPKLYKGKTSQNGATIEDLYNVTTETIFGDFWLKLADGFKVLEASLFDRNDNIVSYQIIHPDVYHSGMRASRDFFSTGNTVQQYGYRLVICKTDDSQIVSGETIITDFVSMNDCGLHRWIPNDLPNYDIALRRINYIQHLRWIPLAKVPNSYGSNAANDYFCLPGRVQIGVPYSDVAETRKYVPNNVSIRTFLTAVHNKRSLLYTEELNNNVSKYGLTYIGGNRRCYYGEVCSGFTAWVMGLNTLYLSGVYNNNGIPGMSTVNNPTAQNVKPLDFMWSSGHITLISDIWKDEFDNVVYVVVSEMSTPYPYRTLYTVEQFEARLAAVEGTIHRWTGWSNVPEPENLPKYSQYNIGSLPFNFNVNEDIMTFAGDYAAFADGDKIVLNCKRINTWTSVQLYKDNVLLQIIDISNMYSDGIYDDDEDWVALDLSSYNLSAGKYKARMTDGTYFTDYTYFEIVSVSFSAVKDSSNLIISFSANGGTPTSIEQCQNSGFAYKYHPITSEEITEGSITLINWEYSETYPMLYILVNGDYGTVCKRLEVPQE